MVLGDHVLDNGLIVFNTEADRFDLCHGHLHSRQQTEPRHRCSGSGHTQRQKGSGGRNHRRF